MDYKQFLSDTIPERAFWFSNGAVVRNIYELVKELKMTDENAFKYHSNPNHDDFAKWITEALGDDILSKRLRYVRDKKTYIYIIERRISFAERRNNAKGVSRIIYNNFFDKIKKDPEFLMKLILGIIFIIMFAVIMYLAVSSQYNINKLSEQIYVLEEKNTYFNNYVAEQLLRTQKLFDLNINSTNFSAGGASNYSVIINPEKKIVLAPSEHISKESIVVMDDRIMIYLQNPSWAVFGNTSSMIPVLDKNSKSIELKPLSIKDIHIGDIISYNLGNEIIVHRIIDMGYDEKGFYAVTKGDNNDVPDPYKVRFEQINGIVVALIY